MTDNQPSDLTSQVAVLVSELRHNTDLTVELLRIVKGDNGSGLVTKVALLEQGFQDQEEDYTEKLNTHIANCPVKTDVKWNTWGVRILYGSGVLGLLVWLVRDFLG